jgi:hypothetical protein
VLPRLLAAAAVEHGYLVVYLWLIAGARVRPDVVARVLWGPPENIAADIRLVGPWRSLSGPCSGPLRSSTCIVTRQPSVRITWRPTSAALADIRSQRTMPSAYGGALPASSAVRTEPASVPVSFRPPGCSPTTDLARFGSAVPPSRAEVRASNAGPPRAHRPGWPNSVASSADGAADVDHAPGRQRSTSLRADNDITPGQPRLTGADTAVSIGSDRDGLSGA